MAVGKSMGTLTLFLRGDATQLIATMATVEKTMMAKAAKMRSIGLSMSMYLTAPLALIGTSMAKSVMQFDEAMNKSVAIMGTQGQQMRAEMEKTAIDISKTTTTTATEMAEAYFFLASAGLNAEQAIKALAVVEKFAVAGSFDMAQATTLAMDSQAALGMKSKDAEINMRNLIKVTDMLVGANTLANATTEQFAIALTHGAGAAMKNFKIDMADGIAILAAYADQGIKAERAGNMFSRMIRLQTAGVIRNKNAWKQFGVNIYDSNNNLKPLTDMVKELSTGFAGMSGKMIATNLHMLGFKARSQQAIFPLIGMTEKTQEFMAALQNMSGMTEEVANTRLESLSSQLKIARNHLTAASLSMKESLVPVLEKLNKALKATGEWWESQTLAVKDATVKWGIIIALVGPGLIVLSFGMKMLTATVVTLTGAITALYTVLSASLIPAMKGVVSGTAAMKVGFTGIGATAGVAFGAAVVAATAVVAAIHQILVTTGLIKGQGLGDWLTQNFEGVAVASAHMSTMVLLAWENIKFGAIKAREGIQGAFWKLAGISVRANRAMWKPFQWLLDKIGKGFEAVFKKIGETLTKVQKQIQKIPGLGDVELGGDYFINLKVNTDLPGKDLFEGAGNEILAKELASNKESAAQLLAAGAEYEKNVAALGEGLGNRLVEIEEQFAPVTEAITDATDAVNEYGEEAAEKVKDNLSAWDLWWDNYWADSGQKWIEYKQRILNVVDSITDLSIKAFDQMGDAMADMLMGNEVNWKTFARNILAELITLLTKALLVYAVLALFPGLMGVFAFVGQAAQVTSQAQAVTRVAGATQQAKSTQGQLTNGGMDIAVGGGQAWFDQGLDSQPEMHTGGIVGRGPLKSDERVVVAQTGEAIIAKDQLRDSAREENTTPSSNFKIVNVLERKEMLEALASTEGEKMVVNIMRRNGSEVKGMIG